MTDEPHYARSGDMETSHQAARANPVFRKGQKWLLLKAHIDAFTNDPENYDGLTADEAWQLAGGTVPSVSCYWHRHGDLDNQYGLLKVAHHVFTGKPIERIGVSGKYQVVRKLTREGWDYYYAHAPGRVTAT